MRHTAHTLGKPVPKYWDHQENDRKSAGAKCLASSFVAPRVSRTLVREHFRGSLLGHLCLYKDSGRPLGEATAGHLSGPHKAAQPPCSFARSPRFLMLRSGTVPESFNAVVQAVRHFHQPALLVAFCEGCLIHLGPGDMRPLSHKCP